MDLINHVKTDFFSSTGHIPNFVSSAGYHIIHEGQIFRLLGIPMGFKVSMGQ